MFTRYGIGLVASAVVTVVLLYIMQSVIAFDEVVLNKAPKVQIDFFRQVEDKQVEPKKPEMDPPPQVELPPLTPLQLVPDSPDGQSVDDGWDIEPHNSDLDDLSAGTWDRDGEYMPFFKPEPEYPTIALQRNLEGYVIVQFDVTEEGTVENPVVIEAKPPGIFDSSAKRAASKFRYKPKILNGQPVRVTGVKNRIKYQLEE